MVLFAMFNYGEKKTGTLLAKHKSDSKGAPIKRRSASVVSKTHLKVPFVGNSENDLQNQVLFFGPESDHWECLSLTDSLTDSLTPSLLFSKLDWCGPGVWRCQLKTCWGCYCCWCCWWGFCLQKVFSRCWSLSSGEILKLKFGQYFAADIWL